MALDPGAVLARNLRNRGMTTLAVVGIPEKGFRWPRPKAPLMSLNAFSQAFAGTDWDRLAAVAAPAKVDANASRNGGAKGQAGVSAGDASNRSGQAATPAQAADKAGGNSGNKDDDSFLTFNDVLDIVNPLQHIPLVDAIYRRVSGDTIRPQGEILGSFLYGGLLGGAIATASVLFHEATGIDPAQDLIALIAGDDDAPGGSRPPNAETTAAPTVNPTSNAVRGGPGGSTQTASAQTVPVRSAVPQSAPVQAAAATPPQHASAGNRARQAIISGNQSALQLLAQDLAAGGQLGDSTAVAPSPSAPTPASAPAPVPLATQAQPGRMPVRGSVETNSAPPPALYGSAHRYATSATRSFPRNVAPTGDVSTGGSATGVATLPSPVGAALPPTNASPARPVPTGLPGFLPLAQDPAIRPLTATSPHSPQPLMSATPIPGSAPTSADAVTPDAIQMLMMRNLDKYQAMSRSRRTPGV